MIEYCKFVKVCKYFDKKKVCKGIWLINCMCSKNSERKQNGNNR